MPAPVGPDDGDRLPRLRDERDVVDKRRLRVVAEACTCSNSSRPSRVARGRGRHGIGRLLVRVEQLEDPLGGGDARLQQVGHRAQLAERLRELLRVLDGCLHVAEAQRAGRDLESADDRDDHVDEVSDEPHRRHDDAADELRLEARAVHLLVLRVEVGLDLLLAPEDLHERVPGERLLDLAVQHAGVLPLRDEALLRAPRDQGGDEQRHRNGDERDERELPGDREHQDERAEHQQNG